MSAGHPPADRHKAGGTPQPLGCLGARWPPCATASPRAAQKEPLSWEGRQPGCIRWGCRSGAQAGEVFGGSWEVGAGWAKRSEGPLRSCGSRVRGKGAAVGPVQQEPDAAKLPEHQDARSSFGTAIAKSRTSAPAVGLRVEEISVMGRAQEPPYLASPCVHQGQVPHVDFQTHNVSTGGWQQEAQAAALPAPCGAESSRFFKSYQDGGQQHSESHCRSAPVLGPGNSSRLMQPFGNQRHFSLSLPGQFYHRTLSLHSEKLKFNWVVHSNDIPLHVLH